MTTFDDLGIDTHHKTSGQIKTTCPECSPGRKKRTEPCLSVNLDDGVFNCWHCGYSGRVDIDSGYRPRSSVAPKPTVYVRPDQSSIATADDDVVAWLQSRGISKGVVERNRIYKSVQWMPQDRKEVGTVAFPYFRDGVLINVKYRTRSKGFKMQKGCERILYGLDDIAETTIIVEGEMDKLACEEAGMQNCVSVPDGAPTPDTRNYETKFDFLNDERLERVKTWIIAVDNDAPGLRLREELVRRMGAEKCRVVEWPADCKDANDVLKNYGGPMLKQCIESARQVPVVGTFAAAEFADDFNDLYLNGVTGGVSTGWSDMDEFYTVMPGQLNVITGIPGHGKSEWADAMAVNLAHREQWRTAFYSPENYPVKLHLVKLAEKYIGKPFFPGYNERMSTGERDAAMNWINSMFRWIMPKHPTLEEVLAKAKALVVRDGVRVLVIDPWNELEASRPEGMTEADYLSSALRQLRMFARDHAVAVFVIAHPKVMVKDSSGKYPVPDPYSVSGGAMWRNKADNFLTIYRDMANDAAPVAIHVQKIKFKIVGKIGAVSLGYDKVTGRYYGRTKMPAPYATQQMVERVCEF